MAVPVPIHDKPLLLVRGKKTYLAAADIHIGYHNEFLRRGMIIGNNTKAMADEIKNLLKAHDAELILIGDIKHGIYNEDREDIEMFFSILSEFSIHIIPGNHDGLLKEICDENVKFYHSSGAVIEKTGFFHGHAKPDDKILSCQWIVSGHIHPSLALVNNTGTLSGFPCWLRGRWNKKNIVVMPGYNPLLSGTKLNISQNDDIAAGPFLKIVELHEFDVYLLSGTNLGKLKNLSSLED